MIEIDLIKKHGKKALGLDEHAAPAPHTWRQRIGEILLEIGIIVFAITLSIWLHTRHEHTLEREQERKFLTGLRADLQSDLRELRLDSLAYVQLQQGFGYFRRLTPGTLHADSLRRYRWTLYNSTNLLPNSSRFEGFKSAGKLAVIEDDALLNDILDNYQELIPSLVYMTRSFTAYKEQNIQRYLDEHLRASGSNFVAVMQSDPMLNYLSKEDVVREIINKYHAVLAKNRQIIRQIDAQVGR